jgi:hypothetical protein
MKLHTKLTKDEIRQALFHVQYDGPVPSVSGDVQFVRFDPEPSRSHPFGYHIRLGSYNPWLAGGKRRHRLNFWPDDSAYAASYDEWGYFIAELFELDPDAKFGYYKGRDDFDSQTNWKFCIPQCDSNTPLRHCVLTSGHVKRNGTKHRDGPKEWDDDLATPRGKSMLATDLAAQQRREGREST